MLLHPVSRLRKPSASTEGFRFSRPRKTHRRAKRDGASLGLTVWSWSFTRPGRAVPCATPGARNSSCAQISATGVSVESIRGALVARWRHEYFPSPRAVGLRQIPDPHSLAGERGWPELSAVMLRTLVVRSYRFHATDCPRIRFRRGSNDMDDNLKIRRDQQTRQAKSLGKKMKDARSGAEQSGVNRVQNRVRKSTPNTRRSGNTNESWERP